MKFKYIRIFFGLSAIFFLLIVQNIYSQYWIRQASPTTKWLYRCSFPDSIYGWVAGDSGVILHTTNAGLNWQVQPTGITSFIYDIYFLNRNFGWCIANGYTSIESTILKTTNGGINWSASNYHDSTVVLNTIYYLDLQNGFIGGYQGVLLHTSNSGASWLRIPADTGVYSRFHVYTIKFYNSQLGFLGGGIMDLGGIVWRTTNGGFDWHAYSVAPEPIFGLYIKNQDTTFGCGGDYEFGVNFVNSTDGGILWEYRPLAIFGVGQSIGVRTQNDFWIPLGFSQRWAHSVDRGQSFNEVMGNDSSSVYDVKFLDTLQGWAFGAYGSILKFNTSMIGIKPIVTNVPLHDNLAQNYPNPFNPSSKIDYYITKLTHVKIILYDITGREVRILMDNIDNPGKHTLNFESRDLSSGVYFYKLITGDYSKTMKMMILK